MNTEEEFKIATEAMNIYQKALELATFDISKISSEHLMVSKDTILDFYITTAKQELKKEGKLFKSTQKI